MRRREFPLRFGKYILLDRISMGGMAEVYFAKATGEKDFQRLLAIKCMLPPVSANAEYVEMFIDEAKLAAQLTHPNVVQILELGRIDDRLYIAMELIDGRDVGKIINAARSAHRVLPVDFAAFVIARAADGLDFAHHRVNDDRVPLNLIHRDVSPHNILVSYDGAVKVADFGVAKADTRLAHTRGRVLKGKVPFMSPEQVRGRGIDKRSDIFALGATFYEMLTGERLFAAQDRRVIMKKIRAAKVPPLGEVRPDLSPEVETIVRRALARDPADRFQAAGELSEALTPLLIREGSVFGARQAGELMAELFADEIERMGDRRRRWLNVAQEDCIGGNSGAAKAVLFQSKFEMTSTDRRVTADLEAMMEPIASDRPDDVVEATVIDSPPTRSPTARDAWLVLGVTLTVVVVVLTLWTMISSRDSAQGGGASRLSGSAKQAASDVAIAPAANAAAGEASSVREDALTATSSVELSESAASEVDTEMGVAGEAKEQPPVAGPNNRQHQTKGRFGFLSVRVNGADGARVFIDGREVGTSPVIGRRVQTGKHQVKIVEEPREGEPGRTKTVDVTIMPRHSRRAPRRLLITM